MLSNHIKWCQLISTESIIVLHQPESMWFVKWHWVKFPSSSQLVFQKKKSPGLRWKVDISMKLSWPQVATKLKDRCCKTLVVLAFFICFTMMMFHNWWCFTMIRVFFLVWENFWNFIWCAFSHFKQPRNQKKSQEIQQIDGKKPKKSQVIQFGYFNFRDDNSTPCSYQLTSDIQTHPRDPSSHPPFSSPPGIPRPSPTERYLNPNETQQMDSLSRWPNKFPNHHPQHLLVASIGVREILEGHLMWFFWRNNKHLKISGNSKTHQNSLEGAIICWFSICQGAYWRSCR